jgi:pimeloyl-ACP methyl ester carboxylesterase
MPRLAVNGVDLYYEEHGHGAPLLLIAGLASDSQSWLPALAGLAASFRVILVDNRGTGRTTPLDARTSIRAMADDCIALIRHLRLGSVNTVGHSMGGFVAQDLALRYPGHVEKLVLAATGSCSSKRNDELFTGWADALDAGTAPGAWFRELFQWIFSARFLDDPKTVDDLIRFSVEYPYPQPAGAFRNQVRAVAEFDGTDQLSRLHVPTLVLAASEDRLFPIDSCERLARSIGKAELIAIDGAGHALHVEQPAAFTGHVAGFLSAQTATGLAPSP